MAGTSRDDECLSILSILCGVGDDERVYIRYEKEKNYANEDFLCEQRLSISIAQGNTPRAGAGDRAGGHCEYALCHHPQNRLEYAAGSVAARYASWSI